MSAPVVVAGEEATLREVAKIMLDRAIGSVPIVDGRGELIGIVTEADFVGSEQTVPFAFPTTRLPHVFHRWIEGGDFEQICADARKLPVRAVLSSPVVTAQEAEPVQELVERMIRKRVSRVPVVRGRKPVGIVTHHDVLRLIAGE